MLHQDDQECTEADEVVFGWLELLAAEEVHHETDAREECFEWCCWYSCRWGVGEYGGELQFDMEVGVFGDFALCEFFLTLYIYFEQVGG